MGGAENKIELAKMGIEIILFLKFTEKMLLYPILRHFFVRMNKTSAANYSENDPECRALAYKFSEK